MVFIIVFDAIRAKSIINDVKRHISPEKLSRPKDIEMFNCGMISKGRLFVKPKAVVSEFIKNMKNIVYIRLKRQNPFAKRLIFTTLFGKKGEIIIKPANTGNKTSAKIFKQLRIKLTAIV